MQTHEYILYISRSILLWAYVLPQVRQDPLEETHKQRLESVRQYLTNKSIPSDLHARVIRYYEFQHSRNRQNAMSAGCEPDPPKACALVLQRVTHCKKLKGNSCVQVGFAALVARQSCGCKVWEHHAALRHGRASLCGVHTSISQRAHDHLETSSCYSWRHNRV